MTASLSPSSEHEVEALRGTVQRLQDLVALGRALNSELNLDRLLRIIMARTTELLDADRSTLFLVDYASDQLWSRVAQGDDISEIRIPRGAGIAGFVATTGQMVNIPEAYEDPRFNREVDRRTGYRTRSILCMPIHDAHQRVMGVIQVLNKRNGVFTRVDEELLRTLSSQAAIALTNANLMEATRKEIEKSTLLLEVMRTLASELELDHLLARILEKTVAVMQADRASLFMVDHNTDELWFKVAQGAELREIRIPIGVGIAGYVARTGETLNIPEAYDDPRFNQEVDRRTGYRTRTILCTPLRDASGTIIGVLQVLNKKSGLFSRADEELMNAVASQAVIAIQNATLFEETVRMKNYNESILRSMATGVVALDMEGRVSTANPATERILGFRDGFPVGVRFAEVIRAEENRDLWEVARATLERGEPRSAQKLRCVNANGDLVTLNLSAVPLRDHKASQIGLVVVIEDISREQQLVGTLTRVVSRQVAEQLLASGRLPSVGGQRRKITVLMSDIRNFTTMTEAAEPEEIVGMLNEYFARMIEVIFRYEGTLDKFIGDAIMAVFGTPIAHPDDPLRAVLTAIGMRQALREFNRQRQAQGKMAIEIGIGICNGEAVSGAIGSEERMEFTVIGDTVNISARLEGLTKQYPRYKILLNDAVYEQVKSHVPCEFVVEEKVKGKTQAVRIYGVSEDFVYSPEAYRLRP